MALRQDFLTELVNEYKKGKGEVIGYHPARNGARPLMVLRHQFLCPG